METINNPVCQTFSEQSTRDATASEGIPFRKRKGYKDRGLALPLYLLLRYKKNGIFMYKIAST
jgi:hypothetical protein